MCVVWGLFHCSKGKRKTAQWKTAADETGGKTRQIYQKVGFAAELCRPGGCKHKCIGVCARVCVCKLVVCPVGEEEMLQRADQVVDDKDKGFSCDPEQGRKANW